MFLYNFSFFDGNKHIPIFSRHGKALLGEVIIRILFETAEGSSDMICSQQPLGCKETSSFVNDSSIFQHPDDIRMDDLG